MRRKKVRNLVKLHAFEGAIVAELEGFPGWRGVIIALRARPKYGTGLYQWALERAAQILEARSRGVSDDAVDGFFLMKCRRGGAFCDE